MVEKSLMETQTEVNKESVLDPKKKSLYKDLILAHRVLKCPVEEAIEVFSELDELKNIFTQNGRLFLDDIADRHFVDKIVVKYSAREDSGKKFIYWSPCNILDFFSVSGIKFNPTGTTVFETDVVPRSKLCCFYGKDIVRSLEGDIVIYDNVDDENLRVLSNVLQGIVDNYINSDIPLGEISYYTMYATLDKETNEFFVAIKRNYASMFKTSKKKEAVVDNSVKKTIIHLNH